MLRLSSPIENIRDHYTVVVVGSGYGGGIAASRLARAGQQVCVLERGKELHPGEYPDTVAEGLREVQLDLPDGHIGDPTGLYDFRVNEEMNVVLGCGLGGTSLINASVALPAERAIFADPRWPQGLRDDLDTLLEEGYQRARQMLGSTPYPTHFPNLRKLEALEKSAAAMHAPFYRPAINVSFQDGVNQAGVYQQACQLCGDCVSGCNYGSKNTTLMNYLPDAKNYGAEIYTGVSVSRIEQQNEGWLVHYQLLDVGRDKFQAPTLFLSADIVVLAAGTLGSTEILLRSKAHGLALSDKVGHYFSGNGDVVGFGYNYDHPVNGIGFGLFPQGEQEPVGPCITGIIDLRHQPQLEKGIVIEEGSIPTILSTFLATAFAAAARTSGKDTDSGLADMVQERTRELDSLVLGPYHGAVHNTQTYLVMSNDESTGIMHLEDDRLRITWPGVGSGANVGQANARMTAATRLHGGTFIHDPLTAKFLHDALVTVHPLGGCVMAEAAEQGVVNHKGQVFSSSQGTDVYEGLYVCDGAVIPRSLAVNPSLTISGIAERTCFLLAQDHSWTIDYQLPSVPSQPPEVDHLGIEFTETMRGAFSSKVKDDYAPGAAQGETDHSTIVFTLTIVSESLEQMLSDAAHTAKMIGTVIAPALSPDPLTVTQGEFNLFVVDPDQVGTRQMRYRMTLTAEDGRKYFFDGFKVVHDDPGFDIWSDTSTLYITLYDGDSMDSPILGKGIMTIRPDDFARQMTTMQVTHAANLLQGLEAQARFGQFFAGILYDTYGGIFSRSNVFDPTAPPRKKRPLRVATPEVDFFRTADGQQLRLTRYRGGSKGPVILVHDIGTSSLMFAIDTIQTNLLEYLFAHGYDIWLLDYRASIELPTAATQFTADDVATQDYSAAIARVRELTGAPSVQVVAHGFGAITLLMAILSGVTGVRAAVCSQVGMHIRVPALSQVKAHLRLPAFLEAAGIDSLTAYVDNHADWLDRLYDTGLKLFPAAEHCDSQVCRRVSFMYGPLYQHEELNAATHAVLHELFGVATTRALEQLAGMTRSGQLIDAQGRDAYLPHLDRLAFPITFIHGAENDCFLPESTALSYDLLAAANGKKLYTRHLIRKYGDIDCILGKAAARDVYAFILAQLEATRAVS